MAPRKTSSTAPIQNAVPVEIVQSVQPPVQQSRTPKEVLLTPVTESVPVPPPVKKTSSKKKKTVVIPEETAPVVVEPVSVPVPEPVVEEDIVEENLEEGVVLEDEAQTGTESSDKKRTRRVVNKDSLRSDFENLFVEYAEELSVRKKAGKKLSLEKYLHKLQNDAFKLLKIRPTGDEKKSRTENNNSGFMKPVKISTDLASFINVSSEDPITRVLITKKICEYIKEKNLQNPEDRREIIPDASLKRIFNLTETEEEPLTYYSMQKRIQSHIFKV